MTIGVCIIAGCGKKQYARGVCVDHHTAGGKKIKAKPRSKKP